VIHWIDGTYFMSKGSSVINKVGMRWWDVNHIGVVVVQPVLVHVLLFVKGHVRQVSGVVMIKVKSGIDGH
jgi:hypothetical protein